MSMTSAAKRIPILLSLLALALLSLTVRAAQFETFGDYEVHYSAINTSFLTPEIAQAYGITRSRYRALLNVSVRKRLSNGATSPVNATVQGVMANLADQRQNLSFKTVQEQNAIYYLTTFRFTEDEPLKFNLKVQADPNQPPFEVNFSQRFYVE